MEMITITTTQERDCFYRGFDRNEIGMHNRNGQIEFGYIINGFWEKEKEIPKRLTSFRDYELSVAIDDDLPKDIIIALVQNFNEYLLAITPIYVGSEMSSPLKRWQTVCYPKREQEDITEE